MTVYTASNGTIVVDLTALKAILSTNLPASGFVVLFVAAENSWFEYNPTFTSGDATPSNNPTTGRWIRIGRDKLIANRTYFVRTDGNDANTGLANTSGGAFLTIPKAINVAAGLDSNVNNVTIQLADGTYVSTGTINVKKAEGSGKLIFSGNASDASLVVITGDNNLATFRLENVTNIEFSSLTIQGTTSVANSRALIDSINSQFNINNVRFGAVPSSVFGIQINAVKSLISSQGHTIFDAASAHIFLTGGSVLNMWDVSAVITLLSSPSIGYFIIVDGALARINKDFVTFSGTSIGIKYLVRVNGAINTNGGGISYLAGNSVGILSSGGEYI